MQVPQSQLEKHILAADRSLPGALPRREPPAASNYWARLLTQSNIEQRPKDIRAQSLLVGTNSASSGMAFLRLSKLERVARVPSVLKLPGQIAGAVSASRTIGCTSMQVRGTGLFMTTPRPASKFPTAMSSCDPAAAASASNLNSTMAFPPSPEYCACSIKRVGGLQSCSVDDLVANNAAH